MDIATNLVRRDIVLESLSGKHLAATLYVPQQIQGAVLIGPATGIKRQFYGHFANFLAMQGYGVLAFDNEGIGGSLNGELKECDASLVSWGEHDLPLALNELNKQFPDTQYHLVGHSAGGQLIGLMPNTHLLTSVFNVACSSGQLSNMRLSYQLKAQYFMNCFIPLSNRLFGFTHSDWVGMGEKLPRHVARQWRQWCNGEGYVKTAFGDEVKSHFYDQLVLPMYWLNAVDDDIANNTNVDDMLGVFSKAQVKKITLVPNEHQLKEIGHMKFFSRKSSDLWPMVIEWFEEHS